jgi:hypothetical protein
VPIVALGWDGRKHLCVVSTMALLMALTLGPIACSLLLKKLYLHLCLWGDVGGGVATAVRPQGTGPARMDGRQSALKSSLYQVSHVHTGADTHAQLKTDL